MTRVLLLTTEPLPVGESPATGAGLRAWGLALGLRAAGLNVTLLMPFDAAASFAPETKSSATENDSVPSWVGTFQRSAGGEGLRAAVRSHAPDVIVLQHWGLAADLGEVECPLAIDLAGPHLFERAFWGSQDRDGDLHAKLDALRRADFVTASGYYQRHYFLPYLAMAGWDLTSRDVHGRDVLPVIPFSWPTETAAENGDALPPEPAAAPPRGDRLVYGGYFLPWQDPSLALEAALDALEEAGRGELLFIGGAHPRVDVSRGRFDALLARLQTHPQVQLLGPMPFAQYRTLLAEGGVALDLMARNVERELAFPTRTVVYLAAGLPVIHAHYDELGATIHGAGAGWVFNPSSANAPRELRALLAQLLSGELDPAPAAHAARALARRTFDPIHTTLPLVEYCLEPKLRTGKTAARLAFEEQGRNTRKLSDQLAATRAELATLRGKRWVRWGLSLRRGGPWMRVPLALAALLIVIPLVPIFWINDQLAKHGAKR